MEKEQLTPERIDYLKRFLNELSPMQRDERKRLFLKNLESKDMPWMEPHWQCALEIIEEIDNSQAPTI